MGPTDYSKTYSTFLNLLSSYLVVKSRPHRRVCFALFIFYFLKVVTLQRHILFLLHPVLLRLKGMFFYKLKARTAKRLWLAFLWDSTVVDQNWTCNIWGIPVHFLKEESMPYIFLVSYPELGHTICTQQIILVDWLNLCLIYKTHLPISYLSPGRRIWHSSYVCVMQPTLLYTKEEIMPPL